MKINKIMYILLILLILNVPMMYAQEENDFNDYNNLVLNLKLDGNFELIKTSSNSRINEVTAVLSFFPENDNIQKVNLLEEESNPQAEVTKNDEAIIYKWNNPQAERFTFGYQSTIINHNIFTIVDQKVNFPIEEVENDYVTATEYIDITPEIREKAREITAGEDDLYVAAFKVGNWVQQ